jgi:hypothetical protein
VRRAASSGVRILESRINELSRRQQRGIEYSDEEGSQQAAGNEPPTIQSSPRPPEPRCGPFQIGFLFQVGDFAGRSMARGRYRRQREYPQPPPPSKNNTTITINTVSIVSPLFGLSILNSDITLTQEGLLSNTGRSGKKLSCGLRDRSIEELRERW